MGTSPQPLASSDSNQKNMSPQRFCHPKKLAQPHTSSTLSFALYQSTGIEQSKNIKILPFPNHFSIQMKNTCLHHVPLLKFIEQLQTFNPNQQENQRLEYLIEYFKNYVQLPNRK